MGLFDAARSGVSGEPRLPPPRLDLMHVSDVATAVIDVLRHDGPLHSVYNLEGYRSARGEIVAESRRIRPDARITLSRLSRPILFPLISGKRLRAEVGFGPQYDRRGFVQAMLS